MRDHNENDLRVRHRHVDLGSVRVFVREAGRDDAPVVLLPHGSPCSSYEFRGLMPKLADRWRLIAPDFPGCGYSDDPADFRYDFDGYADFLDRLVCRTRPEPRPWPGGSTESSRASRNRAYGAATVPRLDAGA